MLYLFCLVPLACWLLAARSRRSRLRFGLALSAIVVVQVVISFEEWSLRSCYVSLEVLLSFTGVIVLAVAMFLELRANSIPWSRFGVSATLATLYFLVLVLGAGWLTVGNSGTLDGPGGHGGKQPPTPPADALGTLPAGLRVVGGSVHCSRTNWGPYCERSFALGSTDGTSDREVADRIVRYLQDERDLLLVPGAPAVDGRIWEACRTTGWWLDVEVETIGVRAKNNAPTEVSIELDHQGCA
ncbi:hypothetical protein ACFXO9_03135 [Nocardia tengchongensis]|uniref:hypothetical protein n=1 Tax=Nocardia tengchongensis TaxID=2055889 RepID=UPI00368DDDB0